MHKKPEKKKKIWKKKAQAKKLFLIFFNIVWQAPLVPHRNSFHEQNNK